MKKIIFAAIVLLISGSFALAQSDIRRIDFKNFTYQPFCAGEETRAITVKNSEFYEEKVYDEYTDFLDFRVFSVTYGDLNGDGRDEAFALSLCNPGGTSYFSEGFVYTLKDGEPYLLHRFEGGDRASGGLRSAKLEKGVFIVERYVSDETGEACCPEYIITTKYNWNGRELIAFETSAPKEMYPASPITFENGKKSVNLNVSIPAGKFKRYSLKALSQQTVTISSASKAFVFRLFKGDAGVAEKENGILITASENGEYVFQFENASGANIEAIVKIEIK